MQSTLLGVSLVNDKAVDLIAEARVIKADHIGEYDYDFFPFKIDKRSNVIERN